MEIAEVSGISTELTGELDSYNRELQEKRDFEANAAATRDVVMPLRAPPKRAVDDNVLVEVLDDDACPVNPITGKRERKKATFVDDDPRRDEVLEDISRRDSLWNAVADEQDALADPTEELYHHLTRIEDRLHNNPAILDPSFSPAKESCAEYLKANILINIEVAEMIREALDLTRRVAHSFQLKRHVKEMLDNVIADVGVQYETAKKELAASEAEVVATRKQMFAVQQRHEEEMQQVLRHHKEERDFLVSNVEKCKKDHESTVALLAAELDAEAERRERERLAARLKAANKYTEEEEESFAVVRSIEKEGNDWKIRESKLKADLSVLRSKQRVDQEELEKVRKAYEYAVAKVHELEDELVQAKTDHERTFHDDGTAHLLEKVENLTADLSRLGQEKDEALGQVKALKKAQTVLTMRVGTLEEEKETALTDLQAMQGRYATDVSELEEAVQTHEGTIARLEAKVAELQKRRSTVVLPTPKPLITVSTQTCSNLGIQIPEMLQGPVLPAQRSPTRGRAAARVMGGLQSFVSLYVAYCRLKLYAVGRRPRYVPPPPKSSIAVQTDPLPDPTPPPPLPPPPPPPSREERRKSTAPPPTPQPRASPQEVAWGHRQAAGLYEYLTKFLHLFKRRFRMKRLCVDRLLEIPIQPAQLGKRVVGITLKAIRRLTIVLELERKLCGYSMKVAYLCVRNRLYKTRLERKVAESGGDSSLQRQVSFVECEAEQLHILREEIKQAKRKVFADECGDDDNDDGVSRTTSSVESKLHELTVMRRLVLRGVSSDSPNTSPPPTLPHPLPNTPPLASPAPAIPQPNVPAAPPSPYPPKPTPAPNLPSTNPTHKEGVAPLFTARSIGHIDPPQHRGPAKPHEGCIGLPTAKPHPHSHSPPNDPLCGMVPARYASHREERSRVVAVTPCSRTTPAMKKGVAGDPTPLTRTLTPADKPCLTSTPPTLPQSQSTPSDARWVTVPSPSSPTPLQPHSVAKLSRLTRKALGLRDRWSPDQAGGGVARLVRAAKQRYTPLPLL